MDTPHSIDWWPEPQLSKHPVTEVFVCGRQTHPPLYSHVVCFPRLEIPLSGCYENQIETGGVVETVTLSPGSALFAAPNCWNFPTWRRKGVVMAILFGKKQLGVSLVTANGPHSPQLVASRFSMPKPVTGPLPHILEAMLELQLAKEPKEAFPELTRAMILCLRRLVCDTVAPEPDGRGQSLLERICVFLQSHYQNDITRETVAQQFTMSPNHLSRLFQTHGQMTFTNYLTHVRVDRAKYLLCNYDLKLEDIAARCGYRDSPYFCRVFKRLAKTTPADYRARMQDRTNKVP